MKCEICGATMEPEMCGACSGSGTDDDVNNGSGGPCEWCDGSGEWQVCPNAGDAAHKAAYRAQ